MKTLLLTLAACLASAAVGLAVRASREMPRRIRVNGHALRMSIAGTGSPAVVFESFGSVPLEIWNRVEPSVRTFARTVAYDHAGQWASQPGPKPRDARQIARELHAALREAGVSPPYILVGYSFGGPYSRVFAGLYQDEIAGLVLVDPTQEGFMRWLDRHYPDLVAISAKHRDDQDEWGCSWDSMGQASTSPLPRVPMTLITGTKSHDLLSYHLLPRWLAAHQTWLAPIPESRHIVTTNSGHGIPRTEPGLVIDAIREIHERVRP